MAPSPRPKPPEATVTPPARSSKIAAVRQLFGLRVLALALVVGGYLVATLDPGGSYPSRPAGPGLTIDETFNVQQGVYLVELWRQYGIWTFDPGNAKDLFGNEMHLPDHPPLGRAWLGVFHHLTWWLSPPRQPDGPFVTACARTGSVIAFVLTLLLVGAWGRRLAGPGAGLFAALAYASLPRAVGHSEIAALESILNLTWLVALATVAGLAARESAPPRMRFAAAAGVTLGLALLTKIQAIFLGPIVVLWWLVRWRARGLASLAVWGITGWMVFFLGWPWLWIDPVNHIARYLGRTVDRATLHVYYLGQVWPDTGVPWHYPLVMLAATTPVLILGTALGAAIRFWRMPRTDSDMRGSGEVALLALAIAVPLAIFSMPGVAVYDGIRLFLVVLPPLAILSGAGLAWLEEWLTNRVGRKRAVPAIWGLLVCSSFWTIWSWPFGLSAYGEMTGGPPGASWMGLEQDYWSTGIDRTLLEETTRRLPEGSTVAVAPVLHQFQTDEMLLQSPILRGHRIQLASWSEINHARVPLLVFERRADLSPEVLASLSRRPVLAETVRFGVRLAALYGPED
ncbi:MAG: glycosyltransferase family 39 protein [Planctomycetaceae bacterium]|nr:glycosyltransferase family 39 protein [Planctomycetaceae bacterium]